MKVACTVLEGESGGNPADLLRFIKGNNEESYFDDAGIDGVLRNVG